MQYADPPPTHRANRVSVSLLTLSPDVPRGVRCPCSAYLDLGKLIFKDSGFQKNRFDLRHADARQRQFVVHVAVAITDKQPLDC